MKNKMLWLAHMMSDCTRRIKITLVGGKEIIGKTVGLEEGIGEEFLPNAETFDVLVFEEDFTKETYFLLEEDIKDIDPIGWELD